MHRYQLELQQTKKCIRFFGRLRRQRNHGHWSYERFNAHENRFTLKRCHAERQPRITNHVRALQLQTLMQLKIWSGNIWSFYGRIWFPSIGLYCEQELFLCSWRYHWQIENSTFRLWKKLDEIQKIDRKIEIPLTGAYCDLIWSDPVASPTGQMKFKTTFNESR